MGRDERGGRNTWDAKDPGCGWFSARLTIDRRRRLVMAQKIRGSVATRVHSYNVRV